MKVAFYKGTHKTLVAGMGNRLIRWWTSGQFSHVEAVFEQNPDGTYLCASSSLMDGGVRFTNIDLSDDKWVILDVEAFDAIKSKQWFTDHVGCSYDVAGIFGFIFNRGIESRDKYFCNESVGTSTGIIQQAHRFDPNSFYYLCLSLIEATNARKS